MGFSDTTSKALKGDVRTARRPGADIVKGWDVTEILDDRG